MLYTTSKRADELKPGDLMLAYASENIRPRFVASVKDDPHSPNVIVYFLREEFSELWTGELRMTVIEGLLTPAQQHAEELARKLELARDTLLNYPNLSVSQFTSARNLAVGEATELLNKIKPPEPPTLEEALALVENLANGHSIDRVKLARELLDRARRAGVLK